MCIISYNNKSVIINNLTDFEVYSNYIKFNTINNTHIIFSFNNKEKANNYYQKILKLISYHELLITLDEIT